jgi:hypothetical protein
MNMGILSMLPSGLMVKLMVKMYGIHVESENGNQN